MLDYELGEMKGIDGSVLWYEVKIKASEYAVRISSAIESSVSYRHLNQKLSGRRLILYFQYLIKEKIYPYVCQGCVIQWFKRNGSPIPNGEETVLIPKDGIFSELNKCWDFKDVPIKSVDPVLFNFSQGAFYKVLLRKLLRRSDKTYIGPKTNKWLRINKDDSCKQISNNRNIACHYIEGIDSSRRNDLNWYSESAIDPKRILIYFDNLENKTGKPIKNEIIQQIVKQGFKWIALKRNIVENQGSNYWQPRSACKDSLHKKRIGQNNIDSWIVNVGNDLLEQVYYWRSFYDDFNISINYTPEEGSAKNIVQAIAFDVDEKKFGALVGKQRSEIFLPFTSYLGYYPKHLFFIWNKRAISYANPSYEQIENFIVTGYPNNIYQKKESPASTLKAEGVSFVVVLFDNTYGEQTSHSANKTQEFYQKMLEWILQDERIGVVIKSKKPYVIKNLPAIHLLLDKVLETGRCIKLEKEWGRFPSDASIGADMSLGIGISSAVIEAVIGGCRGIHYDISRLKKHEFYKWGYEQIIFDNLERLIAALEKYKNNPQNESRLGEWSHFMDLIDPFCDGKGGMRMGSYMRLLLEGFDKGFSRHEATQYANSFYRKEWGEDKVFEVNHG